MLIRRLLFGFSGVCLAGYTKEFGTGNCVLCPRGTYNSTGNHPCQICPIEMYSMLQGETDYCSGAAINQFSNGVECGNWI